MTGSRRWVFAAVLAAVIVVLLYAFGIILPAYTLTVEREGQGTISPDVGEHEHRSGDTVELSASPAEGYEFEQWSATAGSVRNAARPETNFTMPGEDATVTARFVPLEYEVSFEDWEGETLEVLTVTHGSAAEAPEAPEREGYEFVGWDTDIDSITGDVTVTAEYEVKEHTVTFEDYDGTVLDTQTVEHGAAASLPEEPERDGYEFLGWDGEYEDITEDVTLQAEYEVIQYTVVFEDYDGTVLDTQTVDHGSGAEAPEDPEREGYEFVGWDTDFDSVTEDLTVTAVYEVEEHTVTFEDWDGSVIDAQTVEHGAAASLPEVPEREGYEFTAWDGDYEDVTTDVTIRAEYEILQYTVTFEDYDGTVLDTQAVDHGSAAPAPVEPERDGYAFVGWDTELDDVTADLTVAAVYEIKEYTVIFEDWDGTVLAERLVEHGEAVQAPDDPQRYDHRFVGWDHALDTVEEDMTITAEYEPLTHGVIFEASPELAGASVAIFDEEDMDEDSQVGRPVAIGIGGMAVRDLISGTYWFRASLDGYEEKHGDFVVEGANVTVPIDLTPKPGSISGTITDGTTEEGIRWAGLAVYRGDSTGTEDLATATVTADEGEYRLPNLKPGEYTVTFRAHGYETHVEYPVVVRPGQHIQNMDVTLARIVQEVGQIRLEDFGSRWVSFVVKDSDGEPYDGTVPWAVSLVEAPGENFEDISYEAHWDPNIDSDGRATLTFEDLTAAEGFNRTIPISVETDDGSRRLDVLLRLNVIGDAQEQ